MFHYEASISVKSYTDMKWAFAMTHEKNAYKLQYLFLPQIGITKSSGTSVVSDELLQQRLMCLSHNKWARWRWKIESVTQLIACRSNLLGLQHETSFSYCRALCTIIHLIVSFSRRDKGLQHCNGVAFEKAICLRLKKAPFRDQ